MQVVLTIAGSDPSGGAGIQADLRTFEALGVVGLSSITAVTAQNSGGVKRIHVVPVDVLKGQLEAILEDTRPHAVKIGMLPTAKHVVSVAEALQGDSLTNVVLDPVLASSGGFPLTEPAVREAILNVLAPLCTLITPNIGEITALTGRAIDGPADMHRAAEALLEFGVRNVLVKGGHLPGDPVDVLVGETGNESFGGKRVQTPHTHGTGCLLSSAIAAGLSRGLPLRDAVRQAKEILTSALRSPVNIGGGRGYPSITAGLVPGPDPRHAERLGRLRGLYVITDTKIWPGRTHAQIARAAVAGGATVVQLRDKEASSGEMVTLATELVEIVRPARGLVIVNDRVDVAMASDADGVHLGPDDLSPRDARRLLPPDRLVGVSVANVDEARKAAPFASYFGVGAIFGSSTKLDAGAAIGTDQIRDIHAAYPKIPIVAIGGISSGNISKLQGTGASAAAVISAVVGADDMEAACRELIGKFD